jgi:hypothetical protein
MNIRKKACGDYPQAFRKNKKVLLTDKGEALKGQVFI